VDPSAHAVTSVQMPGRPEIVQSRSGPEVDDSSEVDESSVDVDVDVDVVVVDVVVVVVVVDDELAPPPAVAPHAITTHPMKTTARIPPEYGASSRRRRSARLERCAARITEEPKQLGEQLLPRAAA